MEMHDPNDRKFWREFCEKYGEDLDGAAFEDDYPRYPRGSSEHDVPKKSRKRGGFIPFVSIGINFGKD